MSCVQPLGAPRTLEPMPTFARPDGLLDTSPTGAAPKLGAKPLLPSKASPVSAGAPACSTAAGSGSAGDGQPNCQAPAPDGPRCT